MSEPLPKPTPNQPDSTDESGRPDQSGAPGRAATPEQSDRPGWLVPGQTFTSRDGVTYKVVKRQGRRPKGEPPPAGPQSTDLGQTAVARHRRAPRIGVFLLLGAVCGALIAGLCTVSGDVDPDLGPVRIFGLFALVTVPIGVILGGAVAYGLDVRSRRRAERLVPGAPVAGAGSTSSE